MKNETLGSQNFYARYPTLHQDRLIFCSEDDLWVVSSEGGEARRLTSQVGRVSQSAFSPDGKYVALLSTDEGQGDIYLMPAEGGPLKRMTYHPLGWPVRLVGWTPDSKEILICSNEGDALGWTGRVRSIALSGGLPKDYICGPGSDVAFGPNGAKVLGRNTSKGLGREAAHWKRYRGGTAGAFWIDRKGDGNFVPFLKDLGGNLDCPMWIGDRIYFISDHEGWGNLYSVLPSGKGYKRHTNFNGSYVRHAHTDGERIVFMVRGEIFIFDPEVESLIEVPIQYHSTHVQKNRRIVTANSGLESATLSNDGKNLAVVLRGKPVVLKPFFGGAAQFGKAQGVRHKAITWLDGGKSFICIQDEGGEECLTLFDVNTPSKASHIWKNDLGIVRELVASPDGKKVALSNFRAELWILDVASKKLEKVDHSKHLYGISGLCFSPDNSGLAYSKAESPKISHIHFWDLKKKKSFAITSGGFRDLNPSFDPAGKYLYFVSHRRFDPSYDVSFFELSFPSGFQPFCVVLAKDTPHPFLPHVRFRENPEKIENETGKKNKKQKDEKTELKVIIDFEGIEKRVLSFPIQFPYTADYFKVQGGENSICLLRRDLEGELGSYNNGNNNGATFEYFSFDDQKLKTSNSRISDFSITNNGKHILLATDSGLRVFGLKEFLGSGGKYEGSEVGPKSGYIDMDRIRVEVDPAAEWSQMLRECWRLTRENFWDPNMGGLNWDGIYENYKNILPRIQTRSELSDLLWELQGELATSHAYEGAGDYRRRGENIHSHTLGCDFEWDSKLRVYKITHISHGDPWVKEGTSSLALPGIALEVGDQVLAVNQYRLDAENPPTKFFIHPGGHEIELTVKRKNSKKEETLFVPLMKTDMEARYREWVESKRSYVHKKSGGRLGYIHVPDMGATGFSEFHRNYHEELHHDGLVVDVRYNGGGHVSQKLLETLSRKTIGYDLARGSQELDSYPSESPRGPIVCLTNEYAGSDGDMFSHAFKLMGLGPLVGTRTWGGVVGIWPQVRLMDGSNVTQPQFAFFFKDVGWDLENYGAVPTHEVLYTPQDYKLGRDPQLDKGIELAMKELSKKSKEKIKIPPIPKKTAEAMR